MEKDLTMEEIEEQFDNEWVLVAEPQTNENLEVLKGKVLHHSKDRDEIYRKAISLRLKRSAILYIGEIVGETALLSEMTLTKDWERPEENEAWSHLHPARS